MPRPDPHPDRPQLRPELLRAEGRGGGTGCGWPSIGPAMSIFFGLWMVDSLWRLTTGKPPGGCRRWRSLAGGDAYGQPPL